MRDEVEKIIIEWLESGNENTTYLAHKICVFLDLDIKYLKCSKCGHKIAISKNDEKFVCLEPAPFRTSGICAGFYDIEISKDEYYN